MMKNNERLEMFLKLQEQGVMIDNISKTLGIATSTLKSFLSKHKYKLENGKYVYKGEDKVNQITIDNIYEEKDSKKKETKKKSLGNKDKKDLKVTKKELSSKSKDNSVSKVKKISTKPKKDRKVNMTQDDMDKLCEVYDWYMQVKDLKSLKRKPTNKKDIVIENKELRELKGTSIKVDKKTWEDFERLCSNSEYTKTQIITQAISDFMKEYKHLL